MKADSSKVKKQNPGQLVYTSKIKKDSRGRLSGLVVKEDKAFYLKTIKEAVCGLVLDKSITSKDINNRADSIYDLLFCEKKREKSLTDKEVFDHLDNLADTYRDLHFLLNDLPSEVEKQISKRSLADQKKSIFDFGMAISYAKQNNQYFIDTTKRLTDVAKTYKDLGTEKEAIQILQKSRIYKGKQKNEYSDFLSNQLADIYFFLTKKKPYRISANNYIKKGSDYKSFGTLEKGEYHDFLKKIFTIAGLKLSAANKAKSSAKNFKSMEL